MATFDETKQADVATLTPLKEGHHHRSTSQTRTAEEQYLNKDHPLVSKDSKNSNQDSSSETLQEEGLAATTTETAADLEEEHKSDVLVSEHSKESPTRSTVNPSTKNDDWKHSPSLALLSTPKTPDEMPKRGKNWVDLPGRLGVDENRRPSPANGVSFRTRDLNGFIVLLA